MNIAELMRLSEAANFNGGSLQVEDHYPEMELTECVMMLPVAIMESQLEAYDTAHARNEAFVEAAIDAFKSGTPINESTMIELSEKGLDGLKASVKKFFTKIKDFIKSIIAKLKVYIDRVRLTGSQLYNRYKNDKSLQDTKKFEDLSYDGYRFKSDVNWKYETYTTNIQALINAAYGGKAITPDAAYHAIMKSARNATTGGDDNDKAIKNASSEELDSLLEKLNATTSSERTSTMVSELTGISDLGDDWKSKLINKLYGDKFTFHYGSDGFDIDSLGKILTNNTDYDKLTKAYQALHKAAENQEKTLTDALDKANDIGKSTSADKYASLAMSKATEYLNKYLEVLRDCFAAITGVQGVHTAFLKNQDKQAKAMFGKILSASKRGKKSENNDVEVDDELIFEV